MEDKKFYLYSTGIISSLVAAAALTYTENFLIAAALVFGSAALLKFMKMNTSLTGRKKLKRSIFAFLESFVELVTLTPILLQPMVPKNLAIGVLTIYCFRKLFQASLNNRIQRKFYNLISSEWYLLIFAGILAIAWYNAFVMFWAAWLFLGLYISELLNILRQLEFK